MSKITFKNFFEFSILTENPLSLQFLLEGKRHDIVTDPVLIDNTDVKFLEQFPPAVWISALKMRYDKLHEELWDYDSKIQNDYTNLSQQILAILSSGKYQDLDFSKLEVNVPEQKQNELKEKIKEALEVMGEQADGKIKEMTEDEKSLEAHKLGYETIHDLEVKNLQNKLSSNKQTELQLSGASYKNGQVIPSTKGKMIVPAKLDLLPLFNKLNDAYGFDLSHPAVYEKKFRGRKQIIRATSGFKFPSQIEIENAIKRFWRDNHHNLYDPKDPQEKNQRLQNSTHQIVGKRIPDMKTLFNAKKEIEQMLRTNVQQLDLKGKNKNQIANDIIRQCINSYTEEKDRWKDISDDQMLVSYKIGDSSINLDKKQVEDLIFGPPYQDESGNTVRGALSIKKGKIAAPPLRLPHKSSKIFVKEPFATKQVDVSMPVTFPSSPYVRVKNKEEEISPTPEENLRGYNKKHRDLRPEERHKYGTEIQGAAIHSNKDQVRRSFLSRGSKEFVQAFKDVFDDQQKVDLDVERAKDVLEKSSTEKISPQWLYKNGILIPSQNGAYYEDLAVGMLKCLMAKEGSCGGASKDKQISYLDGFWINYDQFYRELLQNLGDPNFRMPTDANDDDAKKVHIYRQRWARGRMSSIIQTAGYGYGSRRLAGRGKSAKGSKEESGGQDDFMPSDDDATATISGEQEKKVSQTTGGAGRPTVRKLNDLQKNKFRYDSLAATSGETVSEKLPSVVAMDADTQDSVAKLNFDIAKALESKGYEKAAINNIVQIVNPFGKETPENIIQNVAPYILLNDEQIEIFKKYRENLDAQKSANDDTKQNIAGLMAKGDQKFKDFILGYLNDKRYTEKDLFLTQAKPEKTTKATAKTDISGEPEYADVKVYRPKAIIPFNIGNFIPQCVQQQGEENWKNCLDTKVSLGKINADIISADQDTAKRAFANMLINKDYYTNFAYNLKRYEQDLNHLSNYRSELGLNSDEINTRAWYLMKKIQELKSGAK